MAWVATGAGCVKVATSPPVIVWPSVPDRDWPLAVIGASVTLNASALEVPPEDPGVNTVILKLPSSASKDAGRIACNWVSLLKLVVKVLPSAWATEVLEKFVPLTTVVKSGLPSQAVLV